MFFLIACHGVDDKSGAPDDTNAHSGDTAGETDAESERDTSPLPYDCGAVPAPPTLSTTRWELGGTMPAANFVSLVPAGGSAYLASTLTGAWRTDSNGAGWHPLRTQTTHILSDLAVDPEDPLRVYLSSGGILTRSTDGGESWSNLPLGTIDGAVVYVYAVVVAPYDPQRVYAATSDGGFHLSTDGGDSFTLQATLPVAAHPGDHIGDGSVFWRILPDPAPGDSLVFSDGLSLYVAPDGDPQAWEPRFPAAAPGHTLVRDPADPDVVVVSSVDGTYRSEDGGRTWATWTSTPADAIAWSPAGFALLAGQDLHRYDGAWTRVTLDFLPTPAMAWVGDELWLGADGALYASTDGGTTWASRSSGLTDGGMSVVTPHPVCANRVVFGSRCSGGVYHSVDYGTTNEHDPTYFHYVMDLVHDPRNPDRVWGVTDELVLRSDDGGGTWDLVLDQYHYHGFAVDPADSDTLLLGSVASGPYKDSSARIYRSTDGGATWEDSSAGIPQSEASAHTILHWPGHGDVVLTGFYKGGDASHQTGQGIGLYRSTDRGLSWAPTSLPATDIAWLTPAPGGVAAAAEDGLYLSTDEGLTWTRYDGPSDYVLAADFHGDVGFAVNAYGRVWKTVDAGATWAELSDGLHVGDAPDTWLARVGIDAAGTTAWVTDFPNGVFRLGL